jgi:hypothetical protein
MTSKAGKYKISVTLNGEDLARQGLQKKGRPRNRGGGASGRGGGKGVPCRGRVGSKRSARRNRFGCRQQPLLPHGAWHALHHSVTSICCCVRACLCASIPACARSNVPMHCTAALSAAMGPCSALSSRQSRSVNCLLPPGTAAYLLLVTRRCSTWCRRARETSQHGETFARAVPGWDVLGLAR